jgi:hypothetical protein
MPHLGLTVRQNHSPALAFDGENDVGVAVDGLRHRGTLRLEPDALNPCRYRAFVGDCIRGTSNAAVLFPCRIGTKPENAGTIEGEEQCLSVWRVVNDDRLQTEFDCAFFKRKTAVPKDKRSNTAPDGLT